MSAPPVNSLLPQQFFWDNSAPSGKIWAGVPTYIAPAGHQLVLDIASGTGGGGAYLPMAGGSMTGPLYYTATGGTVARSAQDRAAEHYSALDFGVVCDGVTDDGTALNAALASLPTGTVLYIPGSVFTSQTIIVPPGRKLVMDGISRIRPSVGSQLMECAKKIIGTSTLSPVVFCQGNEASLSGVAITRNGTPAAGTIGLQSIGSNQLFTQVYSYNHARCIQVGAPRAAPVGGSWWSAITTRFDHCVVWRCYEDYVWLINAPETHFYDQRFGVNGEVDPSGATSLVTIDGDLNFPTSTSTSNTLNFIRCQFNVGGAPRYTIRYVQYNADGGCNLTNCYSGGSTDAFLFIDPNCTQVQHVMLTSNWVSPMASTQVFLQDTGNRLRSFEMIGNHIGGGVAQPAAAFSLANSSGSFIGNVFNGAFTVRLDSMIGGVFIGNSANRMEFVGAFTGNPFMVSGNVAGTFLQTATGLLNYVQPNATYGNQLVLGYTGNNGRLDIARSSDGAKVAWLGLDAATANIDLRLKNQSGSSRIIFDSAASFSWRVADVEYATSLNTYGSQLRLGYTAQGGRVDFARGTDGASTGFVGMASAVSPNMILANTTGSPVISIDAQNTSGSILLRTNSVTQLLITDTAVTVTQPLTINASGPTIRSGTGAATGTQPAGSLWLRTDGTTANRLYVSAGAGTWAAVAGV
jgi:hypothetical protein